MHTGIMLKCSMLGMIEVPFSCRPTSTYLGELIVALILACAYCKDTGHCSLVGFDILSKSWVPKGGR